MNKTCNINGYCEHRAQGQLGWVCKYAGYCDFQAPRDSRIISLSEQSFDKPLIMDGNYIQPGTIIGDPKTTEGQ